MDRRRVRLIVVVASVLIVLPGGVGARSVITVRPGPALSYEPSDVRLVMVVEPHADNRRIVVEADSDAQFSSSEVPLDGEHSSRMQQVTFKDLPAGSYEVRATLEQADGSTTAATGHFVVIPRAGR